MVKLGKARLEMERDIYHYDHLCHADLLCTVSAT
jgi:hypothetical protein